MIIGLALWAWHGAVATGQGQLSGVTTDLSLAWYHAISAFEASSTARNPGNLIAKVPDWGLLTEVRPDLKVSSGGATLVVRPKYALRYQDQSGEGSAKSEAWLNEGYLRMLFPGDLHVTWGIQNFQWGPAEAATPSNRLVHENVLDHDVLFENRGLYLLRVSKNFGQRLNVAGLAEARETPDRQLHQEGEVFVPGGLLKVEYAGDDSDLGFVVGAHEDGRGSWVGEYFSFVVVEGFSVYGDAAHERGSQAYYPVNAEGPEPPHFEKSGSAASTINTLSVLGLRYESEDAWDGRIEWVHSDFGYSSSDQESIRLMLDPKDPRNLPRYEQNLARANLPGLDFPGRDFGLFTLVKRDSLGVADLLLYGRVLWSLTDGSTRIYGQGEWPLGDQLVAFGAVGIGLSGGEKELTGAVASAGLLGLKQTW